MQPCFYITLTDGTWALLQYFAIRGLRICEWVYATFPFAPSTFCQTTKSLQSPVNSLVIFTLTPKAPPNLVCQRDRDTKV
jgi:hypothetical protein